jgi:hypothetical protein
LLINSSVYCMSVYVTMTLLTDRCGNYVLKFGRCIDELKFTSRASHS